MMETIYQLIIEDYIKQLSDTNEILEKKGRYKKKQQNKNDGYLAKLYPNGYFWTHGWRGTKGQTSHSQKKYAHQDGFMTYNKMGRLKKKRIGFQRNG